MWTYNRARESDAFKEVYVATDDERILETVNSFGGRAIMTSANHASGTDRIHEASQHIECTYLVNLQGDEPLIPVEILRDFASHLIGRDSFSLLTCVSHATLKDMKNPNVVKAVLAADGSALYFSRSPIPFERDMTQGKRYKHNGMYGFSKESLERFCRLPCGVLEKTEKLEQLRALEHGMRIECLVRDYESISVDTQEDLKALKILVGDSV
jgi:3-deoxy-manno-octulosonate cytidylyltransferase (CMP-KDO synthetase)